MLRTFCRSLFLSLVSIVLLATLFFCEKNDPRRQRKEIQSDTLSSEVIAEKSVGDSVTSESLEDILHRGHYVLLNFCYCCDCKVTKPLLQTAFEKLAVSPILVTIDVKEHFGLADEYGVSQSPFYILYDDTGEKVDTLYGFQDRDLIGSEEIQTWLEERVLDSERRMR